MFEKYFFSTLTRISDLQSCPFTSQSLPQTEWERGDYVVAEVIPPLHQPEKVELSNGRMANLLEGDLIIGAFGARRATLAIVGDWQSIETDGYMNNLTAAGLFGRATSRSFLLLPPTSLLYRGHVFRNNHKVCMKDFVSSTSNANYNCPTVIIIGTSMSAGKTMAARVIIHQLKKIGLKVIGTKLTGAGRYRDILSMGDAGADRIFDFVDVGLPSSVCAPEEFRVSLRNLLAKIAMEKPDIVVAEAGASPFEPYNGSVVLEEIKEQICFTVLCASDPYAVIGVSQSFGLTPDLISGVTTSTTAGIELVEKLTRIKALNLSENQSLPQLMQLLKKKLDI